MSSGKRFVPGRASVVRVLCACLLAFGIAAVGWMPVRAIATPANVYEVSDADTADTITAVINGTTVVPSTSEKYDGIKFSTAKTYALTTSLDPGRTFSVETDAAVTLTGNYFSLTSADDDSTLSFTGPAPLTLAGGTYGIHADSTTATVEVTSGAALNITGTSGYGIYWFSTTGTISVDGGTLDITNCSTLGAEGGLEMDGGLLSITSGGHVSCSGSGKTLFGDFYTNGSVTVEGAGSTLDVHQTTTAGNAMTLAGNASSLSISDGAVVTVTQDSGTPTKGRAIDVGVASSTIDVFSGGKLIATVSSKSTSQLQSAIRRGTLNVSGGGIVEASATKGTALDGVTLNAGGTSLVMAEGGVGDAEKTTSNTPSASVITGGSVLLRPAQSIVNGQMTAVADGGKVSPTPVNNAGESLTRFDLSGFAGRQIAITAGDSAPAYTYEVGSNHDGIAYVWAPAVRARFYDSKGHCPTTTSDTSTMGLLATDYTIRGNTVSLVNGSVPTAPSVEGMTFIGWIDKATGKAVDPSATPLSADVDLYPSYASVESVLVPIDVYVDDGTGSSTVNFINGPHYSSVGDKTMYETTLDLSAEADKAASYSGSASRLRGSLTLTMTGSAGLAPADGTTYSPDISTYFAGGAALELFDLVAAPTYDASTNTTTFQLKVKDDYADSHSVDDDPVSLIGGGFLGVSRRGDFDFATTSPLATEGYARMKVALSGTLTVWNADTAEGTTFQMTGVQADPANLSDPTLATYGSDPSTTVSATVLYRTPATLDTTSTALLTKVVTGTGFSSTTFGFSITPDTATYADGTTGTAPAPTSSNGTATFTKAGSQTVGFGSITFDKAGTYTYTVQETTPASAGNWTLATDPQTVTVEVKEDSTGNLVATVTKAATITNSYSTPATPTSPTNPTTTTTTSPKPMLPNTGDQSVAVHIPMLIVSALVLLALALFGMMRDRQTADASTRRHSADRRDE